MSQMCNQDGRRFGDIFATIVMVAGATVSQGGSPDPDLPDWSKATFGSLSSTSEHPYFPLDPGTFLVYEGRVEDGRVERIETFVSLKTKTILGVETREIRDSSFLDGVLVEVALDWYAQSDDGTVWYFGEYVENYNYDSRGRLIDIDHGGSWIADGIQNFPGAIMLARPEVGDEYFQEYAPTVALDFAVVTGTEDVVELDVGTFRDVLNTSEGNLFDGPELSDNKLYAPEVGLILIQVLNDRGEPEFDIPLVSIDQAGCLGDIDHDGDIDGADLGVLLTVWGEDDEFADLDGSGEVNSADLGLLLAAWGDCR